MYELQSVRPVAADTEPVWHRPST